MYTYVYLCICIRVYAYACATPLFTNTPPYANITLPLLIQMSILNIQCLKKSQNSNKCRNTKSAFRIQPSTANRPKRVKWNFHLFVNIS